MNKKSSLLIVAILVAVAIAAIGITLTENNSDDSIEANVTLAPPPPDSWTLCAIEHGYCSFPNNSLNEVTYGAGSQWVTKGYGSGGRVACNNTEFGDPAPNQVKGCFYQGPLPTDNWKYCVTEGDTCTVPYATIVKFGADDNWIYGTFNQPFVCNTTTFSDIEPNDKSKLCYYQLN